jgi:phosphoglycolate phosphatase-like HAD superfamily hydrolase
MSSSKLVIFDIDGTLTNTNAVDEECFRLTVASLFKIEGISTNWASYKYSTDSGILDELFMRELKMRPSPEDLSHYKEFFLKSLKDIYQKSPDSFLEIPGAAELFPYLLANTDWRVAIATGAWQSSARFKLEAGNIPYDDIPAAFAEDAFDRKDIVIRAKDRAAEFYGCESFSQIVYVGDGVWDLKAAKECGYGFVGIGSNANGSLLRAGGAKKIFFDYKNISEFLSALI